MVLHLHCSRLGTPAIPAALPPFTRTLQCQRLQRLEQLTAEVSQQPMQAVIGEAVDLMISIERRRRAPRDRDHPCRADTAGSQYQIEPYAQRKERDAA
jgi:Flp pilus assembly CpaF family ATPase